MERKTKSVLQKWKTSSKRLPYCFCNALNRDCFVLLRPFWRLKPHNNMFICDLNLNYVYLYKKNDGKATS